MPTTTDLTKLALEHIKNALFGIDVGGEQSRAFADEIQELNDGIEVLENQYQKSNSKK